MTTVKFIREKSFIVGFEITGHSTQNVKDTEGKIVCAAISSAALMAANICTEIIGAIGESYAEDGIMKVKLNSKVNETQVIFEGLKLHLTELAQEYPERVKVILEV